MAGEAVEGREEVAGNEEGLLGEGESVEVMEGEREESWGREEEGEAEVVAAGG